MGVPKDEAEYYETEVKSGRTLVAVRADGRYTTRSACYASMVPTTLNPRDAATAPGAVTGTAAGRAVDAAPGQQTVQPREEELQTRKTSVETGQVTLGKDVVEENPKETHSPQGQALTIRLPVRRENVTVEKQVVVYERVLNRRRAYVNTEQQVETEGRAPARRTRRRARCRRCATRTTIAKVGRRLTSPDAERRAKHRPSSALELARAQYRPFIGHQTISPYPSPSVALLPRRPMSVLPRRSAVARGSGRDRIRSTLASCCQAA